MIIFDYIGTGQVCIDLPRAPIVLIVFPGQYFGQHYDDSIRNQKDKTWSEWTLLVYLTGEQNGVEGGQVGYELSEFL